MNYYEQIKAEVVKCCPEIMELKNGCLIKDGGIIWNGWANFGDERTDNLDFVASEILGSPIELHHILRTMKLTGHQWEGIRVIGNEMILTIPNSTVTHFEDKNGSGVNYNWTKIVWNLSLPLASQSEETLKFISEILNKKYEINQKTRKSN